MSEPSFSIQWMDKIKRAADPLEIINHIDSIGKYPLGVASEIHMMQQGLKYP